MSNVYTEVSTQHLQHHFDDEYLLTPHQLAEILDALQKIDAFGEVHLVVRKGQLRFIRVVQSIALNGADVDMS